ncbi:hypothetical protein CPB86DRAFT_873412 [Serendipita vermifera]|nr:hypothetical protein CPB86DRAFT_873412 [Serendipita vermifera]
MSKQYEPAVHRIPREIWWIILDEVIDQDNPFFFSTTFEGSNWSRFSSLRSFDQETNLQEITEKQRKIIGSVCRSWQSFAQSRRGLYGSSKITIMKGELSHRFDNAPNARRVRLHHVFPGLFSSQELTQGLNWKIVEINQSSVEELACVPLPRLRRLQMRAQHAFNPNAFLDALSKFKDITWLDYEVSNTNPGRPFIMEMGKYPVILTNLQVLWYQARGPFNFPFQHLKLPSLRYLFFHFWVWPSHILLTDILPCYRQTLRSFTVGGDGYAGNLPPMQFPPWDDFPKLEELVLDRSWIMNFHPLPSEHPLQRLEAQHGSLESIPSLLEGTNMKEVILQGTHWADDGGLAGKDEEEMMDKVGMDRLLEHAKRRGVSLRITWDGRYFPPRPKLKVERERQPQATILGSLLNITGAAASKFFW